MQILGQEMVSLYVQLRPNKNYLIISKGNQATIFNLKMVCDLFLILRNSIQI